MRKLQIRRAAAMAAVLSLLVVGMAAPVAATSGEAVEGLAIADFSTLDEGSSRVTDSMLHVRRAKLAYDTQDLVGHIPIERVEYTINYSIKLATGEGLMWGTWKSLDPVGIRGIHFGKVTDFQSPTDFSFDNYSAGRGNGITLVLNGSTATAGAVVALSGTLYD